MWQKDQIRQKKQSHTCQAMVAGRRKSASRIETGCWETGARAWVEVRRRSFYQRGGRRQGKDEAGCKWLYETFIQNRADELPTPVSKELRIATFLGVGPGWVRSQGWGDDQLDAALDFCEAGWGGTAGELADVISVTFEERQARAERQARRGRQAGTGQQTGER